MKIFKVLVFILLLAVIKGCAINNKTYVTKNEKFIEGQELILNGELELGLQKLEQAAQEEPQNKEIRTVLMRQRDAVAGQMLIYADESRLAGELETAEDLYNHVLELFPRNEMAKAGLEAIELERHHIASVDYAKELLALNDISGAENAVRAVLQENPEQSHARQLIKRINKLITRTETTGLTLETAFNKPFTMEFRDTDMKTVFELMAKTAGINFVFDKDVRQEAKVSIFVRENTVEDILNLILMTNQLAYKILNKNSLLIYPDTPAKQKEYQELVVRSFHVAHTDVKQMVAMIRGLVKAKDIYVNEQLNLFIMRDTLEAIRVVERLVSLNDLPEPEVMLEVVILTITRQDTFNLGPKLPQQITAGFVAPPGGAIANAAASVTFDQIKNAGFPNLKNFVVNNQVAIDFAHNWDGTELLANPRIRVKNREAAKIHIGTRQPFFSATVAAGIGGVVTSTPQFIDIGVKLDVEPVIGLYNDVTLKVTLEVSDRTGDATGPGGATAPIVSTSNAETLLSLKDGETQIIGGLIRDDDRRGLKGLAGLLNIPGLDRLTSSQTITSAKTELMLMITPRVVRNITHPSNMESEFHYGTANAAGKLPLTITKTDPKSLSLATAGSGGRSASAMLSRAAGTLSSSDESEDTPNPFARNVEATPMISLQAPPRVGLDKEFTVRIGLIGAKPSVTSEMQLSYDSDMLEALDDEDNSGTRTLKLGKDGTGKTEQIRFKAITANPGTAEISIQNITAEDKDTSESVEVTLPRTANIIIQ